MLQCSALNMNLWETITQEPNLEVSALALNGQSKQNSGEKWKGWEQKLEMAFYEQCWGVPKSFQKIYQKDTET